ncbi:heme oxygenase (biliverdin-producing) [Spongiactinospora sp. 9N601]|uniref:heme oxygenase (biliverdin-producing) n=1 Tax=Spongiactinospora sp. 9N601 TaxID=3375149 RepID=UPI00379A12E0
MSFYAELREATWGEHDAVAGLPYINALLDGRLPREAYAAMVAQHYFVYQALEGVSQALADDPIAARFVFPELYRLQALTRDLTALHGPGWRDLIEPVPATRELAGRIERTAAWPGGYIAHHYTRYLGDLSGGQVVRSRLQRIYGIERGGGADFYIFDEIPSRPRFKQEYRRRLDALPIDAGERARIIEETLLAYRLNGELLAGLGHLAPAA